VENGIPLAAAGRDTVFFYGTLVDADVLAAVLGRQVLVGEVVPGELAGFSRRRAVGVSYPVLAREEGGHVAGSVLLKADSGDIRRLNAFEGGEYRAARGTVRLADGSEIVAWYFTALAHLVAEPQEWVLAEWQRQAKAGFLGRCGGWAAMPGSN
jgi:gamma-glutamylcyclotransferase (GGCT)/AIG2-like uncharacterized protein YtfP